MYYVCLKKNQIEHFSILSAIPLCPSLAIVRKHRLDAFCQRICENSNQEKRNNVSKRNKINYIKNADSITTNSKEKSHTENDASIFTLIASQHQSDFIKKRNKNYYSKNAESIKIKKNEEYRNKKQSDNAECEKDSIIINKIKEEMNVTNYNSEVYKEQSKTKRNQIRANTIRRKRKKNISYNRNR